MGIRPSRPRPRLAVLLSSLVVLLAAVAVWWLQGGDGTTPASDGEPAPTLTSATTSPGGAASYSPSQGVQPTASAATAGEQMPAVHTQSGLPYVALVDLPPEAAETVDLIDAGGPFTYDEDGSTFGNYEGLLPDRDHGHYREYTVETPGSYDRGARRIVAGADGTLYWTEDHYESFEVIWR